ncbi:MAG: extracellular solute-binding protein [Dongiaceae bacterium]
MKIITRCLLAGAGLAFGASAALADGELHIYNWGNYTSPDMITKFEKTYNVKVTLDNYDSNDQMLAKIKAGGSGYDIVVPSSFVIPQMIKDGLLAKTEPDKMDNFKNVRPEFVNVYWDEGRHYTVPWQWGTTAVSVNTDVYKGDINTWKILFDPPAELKGKINIEPEPRDVINAASYYLGVPICTDNKADLKKVNDLLISAKKNWRMMDYDTIGKMTSKDAAATLNWNGAALRIRMQLPSVKYGYPKEGFESFMDNVAVLATAKNLENAKLFQNFIMDPQNAAMISAFAHYDNGIIGTEPYLPKEMLGAPELTVPAGTKLTFEPACSHDVIVLQGKMWNNLMK